MTLAIALKKPDEWKVSADTWIEIPPVRTYREEDSIPGILKVFVVTPTLCFAFSGERTVAFDALREICELQFRSSESTRQILLESHDKYLNTEKETDYIFCDTETSMFKTTKGRYIGGGANYLFVGNSKASNLLAGGKYEVDYAIKNTGREFRNVGGIEITASSLKGVFHYISEYRSALRTPGEGSNGRKLTHNDDVLTYLVVTPPSVSLPVVALYLPEVQIAYVYDHVKSDDPAKYDVESVSRLLELLNDSYGVRFTAMQGGDVTFTKESDGTYTAHVERLGGPDPDELRSNIIVDR